ncbi:MAG: RNB domain-containing ribonuclease [Opitutaceae bacterium]
MKLQDRILKLMRRADYVPLDDRSLERNLQLKKQDRRKLQLEIRSLVASGQIVRIKSNRYCLPSDADLVTGRIRFRQSGAALVIPDRAPGQPEPPAVSIKAEDTSVAMHGDHVVVRLESRRPGARDRKAFRSGGAPGPGERSGRVIRILERRQTILTGTLQRTKLFHFVAPDDPRLIHDIYVPDPKESTLSPAPQVGDKVVVQLHEWAQRHVNPEGEVIEILGRTNEPSAEFKAILRKFNLQTTFPDPVLEEAATIPAEVGPKERKNRLDLRSVPTLTIDPDDAKDFDDALSLEYLDGKAIRVGIHIADVSAYVQPDTAIDREGQRRGNSTYLVGKVIPMLPESLSNGICSLHEKVDRLVKSVLITFSRNGKVQKTEFANCIIRSNKRLTYKQAYALITENDLGKVRRLPLPPAHQTGSTGQALNTLDRKDLEHLQKWVRQLWTFASRLRRQRMDRGSLDLDMPEMKIYVDADGYADRIEKVEYDESHQLIEEYMLLANETVAATLKGVRLPALYRVHDKPDPEKLNELRDFLATFDVATGDLTNRSEIVRVLKLLKTHPQGHLLRIQILRSLKRACYRASPDGHYGLNKTDYTHFTSPIRRYSDLVVHRVFGHFLVRHRNQPRVPGISSVPLPAAKAVSLAEHLSLTEQNSTEAERESVKVKLLEFFERELKKTRRTRFAAVILETRNHGMFVELTESMAYGLVHVSTLTDDLYRLDAGGTALIGRKKRRRYETGQQIEVQVERVDRLKRQIDFRVA